MAQPKQPKRKPDNAMTPQALRDSLLAAALPHVPFDGWSRQALLRGAEDAGINPDDVDRAFPDTPLDMIEHHSMMADRAMMARLEELDLPSMKIRERIAAAVRTRLEQNADDREAIRRALAILAMPPNALLATRLLYRTVDAMWYAAGDESTDFNFYSKRGLLAAVFSSTVLYWLNDRSDGFEDTFAFLDRRIADVMRVPRLTARCRDAGDRLPNPFRILREFRAGFRPGRGRV